MLSRLECYHEVHEDHLFSADQKSSSRPIGNGGGSILCLRHNVLNFCLRPHGRTSTLGILGIGFDFTSIKEMADTARA